MFCKLSSCSASFASYFPGVPTSPGVFNQNDGWLITSLSVAMIMATVCQIRGAKSLG